jgi:AraC-like DNA-binding protein
MPSDVQFVQWSTDAEAPHRRLELYAATLSSAIAPMHMTAPRNEAFHAEISLAGLGPVSVIRQQGSPHRCYQEKQDAARAAERTYHIILNLCAPWDLRHRDAMHLEPGDAVLVDSGLPWDIYSSTSYEYVNVTLTEGWLRQWVPSPGVLTGRRINAKAGWGRALAAFAAQLSPNSIVDSPLPSSVISDHVGALLALSASELAGETANAPPPAIRALDARIADCIEQRCSEATLTAEQVASSVGVSLRTLHRCLSLCHKSFGTMLIEARATVGLRLLRSPLLRRLTIAEVGRRAGFVDASHFARVMRRHTGRTPAQWREGNGAGPEGSEGG